MLTLKSIQCHKCAVKAIIAIWVNFLEPTFPCVYVLFAYFMTTV